MSLNGEQVLDCGTAVKLPPVDQLMAATLTHSGKAAVDSKSDSTTSGEKTSKLPAALSLVALLLLLFLSLSLLRHILMIPPTGKQQLQLCTCIFTGFFIR